MAVEAATAEARGASTGVHVSVAVSAKAGGALAGGPGFAVAPAE